MMSSSSIKGGFLTQVRARDEGGIGESSEATHWKCGLVEFLSPHGRLRQLLETLALLAVVTALQRWFFSAVTFSGLPHPYLLPVLLISSQYGTSGGLAAAVAASLVYWLGFSMPSAGQDFHAYAGTFAVQPAVWLATALVIGGLRSLHIHQFAELADQLVADRRRADELACGLERAIAEISALERRIATDMQSVAALSRSVADIDLSDRRAAVASFAELFRVGTGTSTFTIYLKDAVGYGPVYAVEKGAIRSPHPAASLALATIAEMTSSDIADGAMGDAGDGEFVGARCVVPVERGGVKSELLAVIVCERRPSQEPRQFRRRATELSRALATILNACPDRASREVV
jgi:hypothetical protein